jgi:hypothetical protein
MSDSITFETKNYRWFIKLKRKDRKTTAIVTGFTPKYAQAVSPGAPASMQQQQEFTLAESNQDSLMQHIRDKVKDLDGPILKTDY